jgi:hypothetical protein
VFLLSIKYIKTHLCECADKTNCPGEIRISAFRELREAERVWEEQERKRCGNKDRRDEVNRRENEWLGWEKKRKQVMLWEITPRLNPESATACNMPHATRS